MEVEKEQGITAAQILDDINVKLIPIAADLGGAQTRTMDQIQESKNRVNSFVQAHRDSSVMVFSDGAVEADGLGMGSCAAVLLPTGALSNEQVTTEVFSVLSDNIEAEVCGIALIMSV